MNVDFHIHTMCSDGGKEYNEIINECIMNDIKYISITDHNTYKPIKITNKNIKIINGMEINVKYNDMILHMLLYNFDLNSKLLKEYYKRNRRHEIYMFNKNISLLENKYNIKINKTRKRNFIRNNNYFDKVRLNNLLVELGICDNPREAFYKYTKEIKENRRFSITMKELFLLEKESKGIVSLAHPLRYGIDIYDIEELILELKRKYNLRVVEAINNHQSLEEEKELIDFCNKNNLYISAGSDTHYKLGSKKQEKVGIILGRNIKDKETTFLKLLKEN